MFRVSVLNVNGQGSWSRVGFMGLWVARVGRRGVVEGTEGKRWGGRRSTVFIIINTLARWVCFSTWGIIRFGARGHILTSHRADMGAHVFGLQ